MSAATPTRLVLLRHGQSLATVDRVVGGRRGDQGLSELGVSQCESLRDRLQRTRELGPIDALYASELRRAIQTAEIIAPAFGLGATDIGHEAALCELDPG